MLTKRAHHEAALLAASRILQQTVYKTLLRLAAPLALAVCNFHQVLVHSFDRQRFGLPEREALLLLGFECNVSSVAVLVVDRLERPVVQAADLPEGFRNGRAPESQLERNIGRRY